MSRTIKLKKYLDVVEEANAESAITPGQLVEFIANGNVQPHSTAGGAAMPAFALEDELQGRTVRDAYEAGTPVQVWIAQAGEMVYALANAGATITPGLYLESAGNGTFRPLDSGRPVAQAVTAPESADVPRRLKIRVL